MTASWFNTPERIASLHTVAIGWVGTPFSANGNTRGPLGGVCCHKLCEEIYRAVGYWHGSTPAVPMQHATFATESLVTPWMANHPELIPVNYPLEPMLPGDLLGFTLRRVLHHLGIHLGNRKFIHAMTRMGCGISTLNDSTWSSRLAKVWRPNIIT